MKKNMGKTDRAMRILSALAIVVLYYTEIISGTAALILLVIAAILMTTSIIRFCPIYHLFGWHTDNKNEIPIG